MGFDLSGHLLLSGILVPEYGNPLGAGAIGKVCE
jgi:hypothetical protein